MDPVAYGLSLVMLAWASALDLRERRVRNRYWVPFVLAAALLWVDRLGSPQAYAMALWAAIGTSLAYLMWRFGLFGGADAKGLMVLAWLWPGVPALLSARTIPMLDLLVNATLLVLVIPILFFVWNLVRGRFAFPAMLLGVEMSRRRAEHRFVWPLQHVDGGRLRWRFWQRIGVDLAHTYADLRRHGVERVWVTPKVPFMVPLTVGAAVAWRGNIVLEAMLSSL